MTNAGFRAMAYNFSMRQNCSFCTMKRRGAFICQMNHIVIINVNLLLLRVVL